MYKIVVTWGVRTLCKLPCASECYSQKRLVDFDEEDTVLRENMVSALTCSKINSNVCFKGASQNLKVFSCWLCQFVHI